MVELAQVVAVLMEPPAHGRAVLREASDEGITTYQVAWRTERPMRPGAWYLREQRGARSHSTTTFDGMVHRHFSGLRLVEQADGRPDYWHPALHLLLPLKGYFWGRTGDDWIMRDDVSSEGNLARVRLTRVEGGQHTGRLVVDMARGLLVGYERPGQQLSIVDIRTHLLLDLPLDQVGRRTSDETWLGPPVPDNKPGFVRFRDSFRPVGAQQTVGT